MTAIANVPYLERRPAGFLFRRRLPARLTPVNLVPADFLRISLRTHVPTDAKELARRLTGLCDLAFAMVTERDMDHLRPDDIRLLEALARFQIEAHAAVRAVAPPRSDAAARQAAACEQAAQDVLRQALARGDREIARDPLRAVAARLGVTLTEDTDSWRTLAFEATRVLLDVSRERERRELGQFEEPSPIFRSARSGCTSHASISATSTPSAPVMQAMTFASCAAAPIALEAPPPAVASHRRRNAEDVTGSPGTARDVSTTSSESTRPTPGDKAFLETNEISAPRARGSDTTSTPSSPANPTCAAELDGRALRARMRPPRLENIDLRDLSEESRIALEQPRGITVKQALRLFRELKEAGYGDDFSRKQVANHEAGLKWHRDSGSKVRFAERFWPEFVGDPEFETVSDSDLRDALAFLPRLPVKHGKGQERYLAESGYRELVERIDSEELSDAKYNLAELEGRPGATEADREQAQRAARQSRLRSETIVKHRRTILAVGKMLCDLQLIDINPFTICSVSNKEKKRMAANEESRARTVWDDRIHTLFRSPAFQGEIDEPGEPMFWLPLIARLMGLREEEACQLSPDDFGRDGGIDFLDVKCCDGNHVKTGESQRRIPVHPQLVELGILKLVELRRRDNQHRLFPHLTRGQTKGKFSENFSKKFTYYRQTNECYWPGLDFHAFRTTFHGDLMNQDKSDAIRCRLMGHERTDEGDRSYSQGLGLAALHERICDVEIDLTMIKSPFADATSEVRKKAETHGLRVVG